MLPRISYFAVAATDAIECFKDDAIDVAPSLWFESNGQTLKGLISTMKFIHDRVLVIYQLESSTINSQFRNLHFLGWFRSIFARCTLHKYVLFISLIIYGLNQVVQLNSIEEATKYYFHQVKQAIHILTGTTRLFTSHTIKKHEQLMEAIASGNSWFCSLRSSIMIVNASLHEEIFQEIYSPTFSPRALPVRFVLNGKPLLQRAIRVHHSPTETSIMAGKSLMNNTQKKTGCNCRKSKCLKL